MYIVLAIVIIAVGLFMILNPKGFFEMTERWKNSGGGEPSDWYMLLTRVEGAVFLVVGAGGLAALLLL